MLLGSNQGIPNKLLVPLHHCSRYCKLFLEMLWFLSCGYSSVVFVPPCSERISNWPWDVGRFKVPQFFSLLSIEFTRPLPNRECWCSTPCSINLSHSVVLSQQVRGHPPQGVDRPWQRTFVTLDVFQWKAIYWRNRSNVILILLSWSLAAQVEPIEG